ncbi:xanthine dehydrogenase family protein subunit M [Jatrophihabitans telluris]|uniref:Xanthine dehydrogenase family protein subunit M n=1 Tax=Jatrophihabitans telluris TaxID=2038343 RepID=A0ABY4R2N1_9ACTN|nr:xanthine dehydrogenase family protein subunit M [Jatrophihabitans telluris]UQX90080.1 xanthine dehydrogenase family protein subunit M [Jatrophihabitans telluris]
MKPAAFDYSRPDTLADALDVLAQRGSDGKVLAGGQSLLPILSMRLAAPKYLIDINRVAGLDGIGVDSAGVRIGALVRHAALERHRDAMRSQPLLSMALRFVAHPTIRNRGTSLGSIVHADPAGELPAVLAVLSGTVTLMSSRGRRTVAASDFFAGPLESTIEPGELAVEAFFPGLAAGSGVAFAEVSRRHGDYAMCGVAARVSLDDDRRVAEARVAYLSMAGTPLVLDLSPALAGRGYDSDLPDLEEAVDAGVDPEADIHASAAYRRQLARVLTRRTVAEAARHAAGVGA